ncbi:unnamed protein product [Mytilus edulis]|uniref:Integrase zinc-binding domain-containing protein n=1 Tax=Mytilus edulis TaxID=6550 RepID=A0A8S3T322_MYTED|nr:unnamed protein product [Mytilus edulis]
MALTSDSHLPNFRSFGISLRKRYTEISDAELDVRVQRNTQFNRFLGQRLVQGTLPSEGVVIQRSRVAQSLIRVDEADRNNETSDRIPPRQTYGDRYRDGYEDIFNDDTVFDFMEDLDQITYDDPPENSDVDDLLSEFNFTFQLHQKNKEATTKPSGLDTSDQSDSSLPDPKLSHVSIKAKGKHRLVLDLRHTAMSKTSPEVTPDTHLQEPAAPVVEVSSTELKLVIDKTFLWTDSQCMLKWLSTKKRVFVENRVQEIKSHKYISFMYVSSKENPADVATRGTLVQKLRSDHLWWHCPSWLKQDENTWEKIYDDDDDDDANQKVNDQFKSELKTSENQKESAFVSENGQEITSNKMPYNIDIKIFSSYHKLRVTAWLKKSRKLRKCGFKVKVQLEVYLDNENLLRCRGRFENADISECAKFPILLPRGETFTRLLVEKTHKELFHSGVSHTLCRVRNKFWIPQGRATVRQILRHCKTCKRFEGGPFKMPNMAPFPRSRVSRSLPFQDYLGPVYVKDGTVMKDLFIYMFCDTSHSFGNCE